MNNFNMGNLENIPTVNQETITSDQELLTVTEEQLVQPKKELFKETEEVSQLEKTEEELLEEAKAKLFRNNEEVVKIEQTQADMIEEAKNLKLTEAEFKDLIMKMAVELPSGETLATLFGDEYSKEKYTHEEFIQAWEKTRWPKVNIQKYEGEKSLAEIEDIFKQAA